jgi:hypothetical protein
MGRTVWRSMAANASLLLGIVLGVKAADYLMWDAKKYEMMKEQIEIDYWKKYGEPTEIEGTLQKSNIKEGEFYITYLRDKRESPENRLDNVYKLH